jgi:mRNA-degrading endonuclease RelE of RelBE toxin-antitoxin system
LLQCSRKEREGLLRKLKEFALRPALGKPLHADLAGYYRISYGRMRCVVRSNTKDPVVLVLVLAPRKEGARDDAYALAVAAIRGADPTVGNSPRLCGKWVSPGFVSTMLGTPLPRSR